MRRLQARTRFKDTTAFVPTTSMADIAFLLIIFFMVTAEFSVRRGMDFTLPSGKPVAIGEVEKVQPVYIDVDAAGRLLVDQQPANVQDIKRAVVPRLEANPSQWVVVRAHGEATYGSVVEVMDQLKQLGVKNIALPTRQEIADWGRR